MIAKSTDPGGRDWDIHLPFLLFAYRATPQASTGESPFLMLYGRDCRLPTEAALSPPIDRDLIASDDYKSLAVARMTEAWKPAKDRMEVAQKR